MLKTLLIYCVLTFLGVVASQLQAKVINDYDDIKIKIVAVETVNDKGESRLIEFEEPTLMSIDGFNSDALSHLIDFDPGFYTRVSLFVEANRDTKDSVIIRGGEQHSLYISSGQFNLLGNFFVNEDYEFDFTIGGNIVIEPAGEQDDFKIIPSVTILDLSNYQVIDDQNIDDDFFQNYLP